MSLGGRWRRLTRTQIRRNPSGISRVEDAVRRRSAADPRASGLAGGATDADAAVGAARGDGRAGPDDPLHARARPRELRRAVALVGRGPRGLLGVDLGPLRRRRRLRPGARIHRDARRRVVPGRAGQLRRAPVPQDRRRRGGDRPRVGAAGALRVDVGGSAPRDGEHGGAAARAGRREGRPRGGLHAEHPRDRRRVPGHGLDRRDLVVVLARLRRPLGDRPLRPDRAQGPADRRRLPLQRQGLRADRARRRRAGRPLRLPRRHGTPAAS
jgi:hypothetical protein